MTYSSPNSETPSEVTPPKSKTIYCINPQCSHRENLEGATVCQNCGTKLLVNNRYQLLKPLREFSNNSYTDVFLVLDQGLRSKDYGKQKVMKVLKFNDNEELVRLFKQEVKTLLWVAHPGIPKVDEGLFNVNISNPAQSLSCFVMEFIEGDNLEDFVNKEGKVNQETALAWFVQIIEILDKLHQQKLPHRDIKPSNLILRPNGQITLIDFGAVGNGEWGETKVGSFGYAAPEQLAGNAVLASDFFGLGKTFVYLLTGRSPTEFPTHKINKKLLWRKHTQGVSALFANLIDDLMADDVRKRPRNIVEIQHRLKFIDLPKLVRREFRERLKAIMLIIFGSIVFVNNSRYIARGLDFVSLGNINRSLQNVGTDKFIENQLSSAEFFYRAALIFNPDNLASEYSLGRVCELAKDMECAEEQYRKTIENNNLFVLDFANSQDKNSQEVNPKSNPEAAAAAASSLTRLQILYQKPFDERLIRQGLENTQNSTIKATLWKNLGWWQFQQNQLVEAEKSLRTALELDENSTAAYCLIAQVTEAKQGSIDPATWAECAERVRERIETEPARPSPEELQWGLMAQQRLKTAPNKP
ncbi:MAG: protein kinase [Coleofasciculaceae cyanobacterium SM2_1_6]|nr:protein kinase [Coleofasciculaceae cyanobacterium SM2_1_6]